MKSGGLGTLFVSVILLVFLTGSVFAQAQFKVGDKVEIVDLSHDWVPGTVIGVLNDGGLYYRVKLDNENASTVYFNHVVLASIRARGGVGQPDQGGGPVVNPPPQNVPAGGDNNDAGDLVDVYYNATQGWNRGRIVERNGNKVRVRFIGCEREETVDRSQIHAPATISANAPPISFLFGRWALTKVGTSSYNTAWGRADGVEIKGDGTYMWIKDAKTIKGRWVTDAKVPGTDSGTQFYDGVLIKDASGREWKILKWVVKGYPDGIQVQRMCSGETLIGSRAR